MAMAEGMKQSSKFKVQSFKFKRQVAVIYNLVAGLSANVGRHLGAKLFGFLERELADICSVSLLIICSCDEIMFSCLGLMFSAELKIDLRDGGAADMSQEAEGRNEQEVTEGTEKV